MSLRPLAIRALPRAGRVTFAPSASTRNLAANALHRHSGLSACERLALQQQVLEVCPEDADLMRALCPTAPAPTSSHAYDTHATAFLATATDSIFLQQAVDGILLLADRYPGTCHELLVIRSRQHGAAEAKDPLSPVGRQVAALLGTVRGYEDERVSLSEGLRQVRLVATASIMASDDDHRLHEAKSQLAHCTQPLASHILETLLTNSAPALCRAFLEHTHATAGGPGDAMWVLTLWAALLANDHFFQPAHFDEMHNCARFLAEAFPVGHMRQQQASTSVVPVVNKMSRVYQRMRKGEELLALHRIIFSRNPGSLRHMPWQYHARLIGVLLDDAQDSWSHSGNSPAPDLPVRQRLSDELITLWQEACLPLAVQAARMFAADEEAIETLWRVSFKAAMLFPPLEVVASRAVAIYAAFLDAGCARDFSKDALAQLVRLVCDAIQDDDSDNGGGIALVATLGRVLVAAPSVNLHWGMNTVASILAALVANTCAPLDAKRKAASAVHVWLARVFLPAKKIAGTDPLNVAAIRQSLEHLGAIDASRYWWTCGCGAVNSGHNNVCSKCVRNTQHRWQCANEACRSRHTHAAAVCPSCGASHPAIAAADAADVPLCSRCDFGILNESDGLCGTCDGNRTPRDQEPCRGCGTMHSSKTVCPKCGEPASEGDESLIMWSCDGCHNFTFVFHRECSHGACRRKRSASSLRVAYKQWECGCGRKNPMGRLACAWCGTAGTSSTTFTCPSCASVSHIGAARQTIAVNSQTVPAVSVATCSTCGDYHPRDCHVLSAAGIEVPCFACGASTLAGSHGACGRCGVEQGGFNPLVPFWCGRCDAATAQTGFACATCARPRFEISDCAFLWRCEHTNAATGARCTGWNPSWLASCTTCGHLRVQDAHEVRSRNLGRWTCQSCAGSNEPSDVLICPKCEDGLHIPEPCPQCRRRHVALECPSDGLVERAVELLRGIAAASTTAAAPRLDEKENVTI